MILYTRILLLVLVLVTTACGTVAPRDALKGANFLRNINKLAKPGVAERAENCIKDLVDPSLRGSRCG